MSRRRLKPYLRILECLDVQVLEIERPRSGHYRFVVTARGNRRFFIVSCTPSDTRALLNWKSDVRKWLSTLD